jgi:hypothetical protein
MLKQLVVIIETLAAETTKRVALETRLVSSAWLVVTVSHMLLQLLIAEQLMLVSEDLFVASAEIAHALLMRRPSMSMEIGPA